MYRILLAAESEGILDNVDMVEVEKNILGLKLERHGRTEWSDTKLLITIKELITKGADVNTQDQYGETALMAAAKIGHTICLDQLFQVGAQPNITDNEGNTALIHALMGRKIECVKKLIAAGADVNIGTFPPLICSMRSKCFDSTTELLKAGADVNGSCKLDNTALIEAVSCGKNTIVQSLLLQGADIDVQNTDGNKAIHLAAERSHQEFKRQQSKIENGEPTCWTNNASDFAMIVNMCLEGEVILNEIGGFNPQTIDLEPPEYQKPDFHILKMLLAAGAKMDQTTVFMCAPNLHLKNVVKNYIRERLNKIHPKQNLFITIMKLIGLPNTMKSYLLFNTLPEKNKVLNLSDNERSLFSNSFTGDVESIEKLVDNQVNVNVKNENGMTPLMIATQNSHVQLVEVLIQAGADVNTFNSVTGDTSLIYASDSGQSSCMQKLLEYNAKVNIHGKNGDTALICAARNGHDKCLQVLIDTGANLNIQNNNGNTALIAAIHRFQSECVVWLIKAGTDVNLLDNQGGAAIVLAARRGQRDFVKKLITAGANLNHFDKHLQITALMTAACLGHVKCMNLLVQSGADLNIPDVSGRTALMKTAELVSSETCFSSLLNAGAEIQMAILVDIASRVVQKEGERGKQDLKH